MRLFIESLQDGQVKIFRDRSPFGTPRWVVIDKRPFEDSITIYSKIWFSLKDIRAIYEDN